MANRQQAIISLLEQEIATAITTANGYNNTISRVIRKNKNLTEITEFPTVWFQVESENREILNLAPQETNRNVTFEYPDFIPLIKKKLNILMAVAIEADVDVNDEGLLSIQAGLITEDFDDFFHKNRPISCSLNTIDWVQYYFVQRTEPILDDKLHKGSVAFRIYIEYIDNEEKIDGSVPDAPVITTPTNGSTVGNSQPNIEWTTDASGLSNHLQISAVSDFSALIENQQFLNSSSYTVAPEDSLDNGTYHLRVRTYNNFGYSDWSTVIAFTVGTETELEPETIALATRHTVVPDSTRQGHMNTLIATLKNNYLWDRLDVLQIYQSHSITNSDWGLNWRKDFHNAVSGGTIAVALAVNGAVSSNGNANCYINTNFSPSSNGIAYSQNRASVGFKKLNHGTGTDIFQNDGLGIVQINPNYGDGLYYVRMNTIGGTYIVGTALSTNAFFVATRETNLKTYLYRDYTLIQASGLDQTSAAPPITTLKLGASTVGAYGAFFAGSYMSASAVSLVVSGINTYITNIGG